MLAIWNTPQLVWLLVAVALLVGVLMFADVNDEPNARVTEPTRIKGMVTFENVTL